MKKKSKETPWLLISVICGLPIIFMVLAGLAGTPLTGAGFTKDYCKIDATVEKWMGENSSYLLEMTLWYERYNVFPDESEIQELITKRLEESNLPLEMLLDQWGNSVFYYNGRGEGKCAWFASRGPDGVWFTGSEDPQTIVGRINEISVQTEYRYLTQRDYFRKRNTVKYRHLIIGDDHIMLADLYIQGHYTHDFVNPIYPVEIFEDAQIQIKRI